MGAHLVLIGGQWTFQSDKYPSCPPGKVPLSVKDKAAQPLLWIYAQLRRSIDAEFSDDLETALRAAGYVPPTMNDDRVLVTRARLAAGCSWRNDEGGLGEEPEVRRILRACAERIEELAGVAPDAKAHAVADCFVHEHEELAKMTRGSLLKLRNLANDVLGSVFYCPNVRCTAFDVETPGNREGVCAFCKTALVESKR
jgi:hypothetical protein